MKIKNVLPNSTVSASLKFCCRRKNALKKISSLFVLILVVVCTSGQTSQFKKGQKDINIGIGLITPLFEVSGYDVKSKTPPITFTFDYGITDELSLGIYLASAKSDVYGDLIDMNTGYMYYDKQSTLTHVLIGARVLYHFELHPKFDTYVGGMLGYNAVSEKAEPHVILYGDTKAKGITYSILAGGRYRFTQRTAVFLELGYGVTVLNLGLNIKL